MHFLSAAQEKATRRAMRRRYKAVAFDIDGTLTPFGRWIIPHSLRETLLSLPKTIPLAFCTGRSFDHIKGKLAHITEKAEDEEAERKRWSVLAENGGACYEYHPRKKDYELFYEVPWTNHVITRDAMEALIKDKYGWHCVIVIREHSLVIRFPDWFYLFPRTTRIISRQTAASLRRLFKKMQLGSHFLIQDSGIGCLIIPSASGKGKAVKRWAAHLKIQLKDVLVIGDQPLAGENDEEFLSGHYGTSFTVGHQSHNTYPLPVLDDKGRKLLGPRGTEYLLRELF